MPCTTAVLLARRGAKVLAIDNNSAAAEEPVGIVGSEDSAAEALICDVTSSTSCEAGMARFGQFDVMHWPCRPPAQRWCWRLCARSSTERTAAGSAGPLIELLGCLASLCRLAGAFRP